jgi:uncharacterized protein (TIGR02996 family)
MIDTELALLRAIAAHPDEDTPRLAYADYLDEHGGEVNALWAELIREQVLLCPKVRRVFLAGSDFWDRAWAARLAFSATLVFTGWQRGFPTQLEAPSEAVRADWDRVVDLVPVRELYVESATDAFVEEFVAWCDLRNLRELFIQSKGPQADEPLTDRTFVALAECPALSELKRLSVRWVRLTNHGADAVLHSPYLAHLREFHVTGDWNFHDHDFTATAEACERIHARFGSKAIR